MATTASKYVEKYTGTHTSRRRRTGQPPVQRTIITRSQSNTICSFFERLPCEVFHMILDRLSVLDIGVFSIVSKAISSFIVDYISTLGWKNKMIIQSFHHTYTRLNDQHSTTGHYKALGLLFKRCTLLLPTKDRLKFVCSKVSQTPCFMMEQCTTADCLGFSSYGIFLQTLIAGWDEPECHRVFNFLCDVTDLPRKIQIVVEGEPGACLSASPYLELQIRLFCRQVLLDPWPKREDSLFWLTRILKPWPMVIQARLLFILYGPLLPDSFLGWQEVVGSGLSHNALWDLAKALLLLYSDLEVKDWTTDTVMAILEELTVLPQAWHVENLARLLVLCGNSLCYTVLANKAVNGRLLEISRLIVYLILVCEKDGYAMSWAVKMVQQVCQVFNTTANKRSFIQSLENMFSEVTMEMYEIAMAGNRHEDLETFQTLCSILNSSAHFHTEFLHLFLNKE
ncbi:F-box only protein 47-like [Polymixia lowei]